MLRTSSFLIFTLILCGCAFGADKAPPQRPTEPEGSFVTVNGYRLWYRIEEEPEKHFDAIRTFLRGSLVPQVND